MKAITRYFIKKNIPTFIWNKLVYLRKILETIKHKGNQVYCPVCSSNFNYFGSFGNDINARCYNCNSLERHRLFWLYLNNRTNIFNTSKKKLLHFAPEYSFYQVFANNSNIEYVPCDFYPKKYAYKGKIEVKKVDITNIPFADNTFDIIICSHVLEHIIDDRLAMSELFRVMKNGAWAILQVPLENEREHTFEDFTITSPAEREKFFGQYDHVRIYGTDYKDRLESVGFEVIKDDYINSFTDEDIFKYGLIKNELIYLCKKK